MQWRKRGYGHGQLLKVGDVLLIQAEDGDVALVELTPDKAREITRFKALNAKTWNYPTLYGEYLLVRNSEEAACYRLPLRK